MGKPDFHIWSRLRGNGDHTPDPDLESFKTRLQDSLTPGGETGSPVGEPGSPGGEPGSPGGEPGSPGGEPGSTPAGEPGSTPGSRGARLPFGLPTGTWAPATWPDWLCRICSPEPPYQPSKAHFRPPVGAVRGVNKSGTADTALKTRLPTIYSGFPPLGSRPKFLGERSVVICVIRE